jgi:hypothetical protein
LPAAERAGSGVLLSAAGVLIVGIALLVLGLEIAYGCRRQ